MSLREWLIAIGTLVILGIVIDGIRRMHRARKESMAISSGMGVDDLQESPLDREFNPELPNGGAWVRRFDTSQDDAIEVTQGMHVAADAVVVFSHET